MSEGHTVDSWSTAISLEWLVVLPQLPTQRTWVPSILSRQDYSQSLILGVNEDPTGVLWDYTSYVKGFLGECLNGDKKWWIIHSFRPTQTQLEKKALPFEFLFIFNVWPHTVISLCTAYWGSHYENADVDWTHLLDFPGIQAPHSPLGNLAALLSSAPPSPISDKTRQTSNYFSIFLPKNVLALLRKYTTNNKTK